VALALRGGSQSFEKVIKMIDDMIVLLGKEQTADDEKKAYCEKELDVTEDDKKVLANKIDDLDKAIDDGKETVATLTDEIAALVKGIKALDKQVAEATEIRQEENAEFKQLTTENKAAKDILGMAKNRLAKFYAPKMYKPPAKEELSAEGRISASMMSFLQISVDDALLGAMLGAKASPGPPPETWGAYQTKSEEHGGVMAMIDLLIGDLDKEITEATTDEKNSQAEYEAFMAESADKRATDSKSMAQKEGEKAEMEAELVRMDGEHKGSMKELMTKEMTLKDLHIECDWLISNFEMRKEARAGEVDSLKKAKAVLSGADYSLVQTQAALRGRL
jgi:chromosome segregation ATPase